MRRAVAALVVLASLGGAESAMACSCAIDPDEKETLHGIDAAATSRLIEIDNVGGINGDSEYTYRLLRIYKGSGRYGLKNGEAITIEAARDGAACGPPRNRGKRYGVRFFKSRGELTTGLCSVSGPKELRRAAERSGNARSGASGCAASA